MLVHNLLLLPYNFICMLAIMSFSVCAIAYACVLMVYANMCLCLYMCEINLELPLRVVGVDGHGQILNQPPLSLTAAAHGRR